MWYYWVVPEVEPGQHEAVITFDFAQPLTDGGDWDGDGQPDVTAALDPGRCTFTVVE
jgi:hypothetical protein